MMETIQFYESSGSGLALRCAVVTWLLLLSGAINTANSYQESPSALTVGQPIMREMRGGEQHTYQVRLNAGQHARVVVDQKGIDVVLALVGPDGKQLLEVDNNLSGTQGM